MGALINIALPVFGIILTGYLARRSDAALELDELISGCWHKANMPMALMDVWGYQKYQVR